MRNVSRCVCVSLGRDFLWVAAAALPLSPAPSVPDWDAAASSSQPQLIAEITFEARCSSPAEITNIAMAYVATGSATVQYCTVVIAFAVGSSRGVRAQAWAAPFPSPVPL